MKRFLATVLCFAMLLTACPLAAFAAETPNYEAIVADEYGDFSKSLRDSGDASAALSAMVSHAVLGYGKNYNISESHAMTATLLNSKTGTAAITAALTKFLESGLDSISLTGSMSFYKDKYSYALSLNGVSYVKGKPASSNEYDEALCLVAGCWWHQG